MLDASTKYTEHYGEYPATRKVTQFSSIYIWEAPPEIANQPSPWLMIIFILVAGYFLFNTELKYLEVDSINEGKLE